MITDDTPAAMIQRLDQSLARRGQTCTLRRRLGTSETSFNDVTVRARPAGFAPRELVGNATQQTSKIILSPTQIVAAGWTSGRPAGEDGRVPMKGNKLIIAGAQRNVEAAVGIYVNDVLVRIEAEVLG